MRRKSKKAGIYVYMHAQAYDRYLQAGNDLLNKYNLANTADRQAVEDYLYEREYADNKYNNERNFDYGAWTNDRSYWQNVAAQENADYWNQTDFDYRKERDAVGDEQWQANYDAQYDQWQAEFDERQRQYNSNLAEEQRQFDAELQEESYKAGYKAAQDEGKGYKEVTQSMYSAALKAYNEGGLDALAAWYDSASDLYREEELDAILEYVAQHRHNVYDNVTNWFVDNYGASNMP